MSISSVADTIYAIRFLKLLVTKWDETEAFDLGLIDDKGKVLRKPKTSEEKDAYTIFHRLVFNVKRLMPRTTNLGSYAAAVYLVREHLGVTNEDMKDILTMLDNAWEDDVIQESWIQREGNLLPGTYTLVNPIVHPTTIEELARPGTQIYVDEITDPIDTIFETYVYPVIHKNTNQLIYITAADIKR